MYTPKQTKTSLSKKNNTRDFNNSNKQSQTTQKDYFTKIKPMDMDEIKKHFSEETYKKFFYLTNKIGIYFNNDYPTKLAPYLALLVLDLKKIKHLFPIQHKPTDVTQYTIDHGYITPSLDNSKEGYILAIAYQNILEQTYGGLSGQSVANLKKWLMQNEDIEPEHFKLERYDVGAIVNYLNFIEPTRETPFSINDLEYALGLFKGDKNI